MTNVTNSSCTPSFYISFILSAKAAFMSQLLVPQGSGVLGFFHTYVGSGKKKEYFWGMEILCILFGGHHKIRLYLGVISMHFKVFSKGQGTEWGIFLGVIKFLIFFGVLEIPDIFWGER